ncbi:MAG: tyrosine-type recombinase/integrase [Clostridiales bacterium]|nr:tyrosine-type recombinase/integrase [Clostridiales bacterium]
MRRKCDDRVDSCGTSSLVEPFRDQNDIIKMQNYFKEREQWLMYLIFVMGICMGRRIGDTLSLRWNQFYHSNGKRRDEIGELKEQKTDKYASPFITESVWKAIDIYREHTGCKPSVNNYENLISIQLAGNYKGQPITVDGCLKAMKRAAKAVGITYNVGNHSTRKTFGYMCFNLFPNDPYTLPLLQKCFNHHSEKVTLDYIGLSKDGMKKLYNGVSNVVGDLMEGKTVSYSQKIANVITNDYDKLRQTIIDAYMLGKKSSESSAGDVLRDIELIMGRVRDEAVV